ncbi:uncharacterized protein B0I36DRAFT_7767 [Microdochium trichocladiopsis]|uniref:Uncharacterized protein n=1 Tax=Microdochium trichocladiopsis TaxID=1682393 RepID=A0A9P8YEE6_9PEZI|nr:uncharacterized protein B0I36DRAFT_7767 [Microdochium trichocladiopsis]KAH7040262.1 hypothetical protein B0I36DRAFT_7767 [Microdochium trichocladiopsis]
MIGPHWDSARIMYGTLFIRGTAGAPLAEAARSPSPYFCSASGVVQPFDSLSFTVILPGHVVTYILRFSAHEAGKSLGRTWKQVIGAVPLEITCDNNLQEQRQASSNRGINSGSRHLEGGKDASPGSNSTAPRDQLLQQSLYILISRTKMTCITRPRVVKTLKTRPCRL